jgi:hypothetical protein
LQKKDRGGAAVKPGLEQRRMRTEQGHNSGESRHRALRTAALFGRRLAFN